MGKVGWDPPKHHSIIENDILEGTCKICAGVGDMPFSGPLTPVIVAVAQITSYFPRLITQVMAIVTQCDEPTKLVVAWATSQFFKAHRLGEDMHAHILVRCIESVPSPNIMLITKQTKQVITSKQ